MPLQRRDRCVCALERTVGDGKRHTLALLVAEASVERNIIDKDGRDVVVDDQTHMVSALALKEQRTLEAHVVDLEPRVLGSRRELELALAQVGAELIGKTSLGVLGELDREAGSVTAELNVGIEQVGGAGIRGEHLLDLARLAGKLKGLDSLALAKGAKHADRSLIASVRRVFADLKDGFSYTWRRANLRNVVLGDALVCFVAVAPMNLTLLLMTREYEGIDLNLGFINLTTASDKLAANELGWSIGMLLGGALMSTIGAKLIRNNMRVVAFGIALVGVSVVGLGVVHNLLAYLLIDVVNGLASAICMGPMRTIIQTEADEKMVGRVFGLDTTLSTLGMPLGMLIFAPLADVIPISLVFIIGGVLTLPIGIYLFGQARRNVSAQVTRTAA